MKLERIFNPKTIAVIGASDQKGSVGHALMDNLLNSDYNGIVYPVNVKHESVHSIKAYPSVTGIEDKIDLAIIATPAKTVPAVVEECGAAGVAGCVIISAGFAETGKAGEKLAKDVAAIARKHEMRIIGPNCLGFMRPDIHLNATFANKMCLPGKLAFISQSGALGTAILDWSIKNNVGFRYFVTMGSMLDITFHDLIDHFGADPEVKSILIYMESIKDARRFMSAARAFSRSKPIIVLKVGRTAEGATAAKSHTGSLTGNDAIFDAAFERAGIIRADTVVGLFHAAKSLAMQPKPQGPRLAVITNAGGPGIIATDYLVRLGGELATLEKRTVEALDKFLPAAWSHGNPVDILGDADPERYRKALEVVLKDANADSVLLVLTPQAMTAPSEVARQLIPLANQSDKTIMATWMGGNDVQEGREILEKGFIPVYRQPEDAVISFMSIVSYSRRLEYLYETPSTTPHAFEPKTEANRALIDRAAKDGRDALTEAEAKEMLKNYEIPVVKNGLAVSGRQAGDIAEEIGFPVAMKVLSPDILHKTDVGGVRLNIASRAEAEKAYTDIMSAVRQKEPAADIHGIFIEGMVKKRYELLIGCKKDPIFGPAIVFGMGGVAVEIFKDTKIGLPPLNMALSLQMIKDTKVYKLLKGYRGMPGVDIQSIQFLLYKFAYLVADFPEILEIDINPFAVDEHGGIVLDAKVVLDKEVLGKTVKPYSHLVISPYPKEYISQFTMKDKKIVTLRPILPEDEPMEAGMFTRFSKETQRQRFFGELGDVTHELLTRYTQIDYDREIAIIAEQSGKKGKEMLGVSRLIGDAYNEKAEFAVVVADPWQGKGLGSRLTDKMLEIASERGYRQVNAKFLSDNKIMRHIFEKRGFKLSSLDDRTEFAELKLI